MSESEVMTKPEMKESNERKKDKGYVISYNESNDTTRTVTLEDDYQLRETLKQLFILGFDDIVVSKEIQGKIRNTEENKIGTIVLKTPVKLTPSKNYGAVLKDADGTCHFWFKNGEYDGYDRLCKSECPVK